jgi:YidC/Oxa1 family membrane protein insertase
LRPKPKFILMFNESNRSQIIGVILLMVLVFVYQLWNAPTEAELANQKHVQDSIENARLAIKQIDTSKAIVPNTTQQVQTIVPVNGNITDGQKLLLTAQYGAFGVSAFGKEEVSTFENENLIINFTNKGGRIKKVTLKKHDKWTEEKGKKDIVSKITLLDDPKDKFEYLLPLNTGRTISTQDLYFTLKQTGNNITYRATAENGAFFENIYTINKDSYKIDYSINYGGLANTLAANSNISLNWECFLSKIEKNSKYEKSYTSLYYRETDENPSYCSCTSNDEQILNKKPIKWVSNSNQFFNSALIAKTSFANAKVSTIMGDDSDNSLKKLQSTLTIPVANGGTGNFPMEMYIGPNDFNTLKSFNVGLEDVISYGSSIFGTLNRWIIRPVFDFIYGLFGNAGIAILLLTLLVKAVLYPLSYKMIRSQAKTNALKPKIDALKTKFKDDSQKIQMETMKLYQEFGVNPLGGCLPTFLQMPIWMALYRFFPANIDFRQKSFLWASDLTSYEVFARIPFDIPMYGAHISLFALLWGLSLLFFTWYSMKDVDMSANPSMKYVQYFSPILFTVLFNASAAGLGLYMLFSNLLNIAQTMITKNYIIDHTKIKQELDTYKANPKKKSAFREKLDEAMKQQQALKDKK